MRVGIISDTHDQLARTLAAVELLSASGATVLIHCGDLTGPEIVHACGRLPTTFVFGNNDGDWPGLKRAIREVNGAFLEWAGEVTHAGKRLAVTHGHIRSDIRRLLAGKPDYLLTGHSHVRHDYRDGPTRRINPGALYRADTFSVAVLDPETDDLQFLDIPR
jgi:putative phosphoesterase